MSALLDERPFVAPAFCTIPPYVETIGAEVADLSASFGFVPDREQELWLDGAFGVGVDGLPALGASVNEILRKDTLVLTRAGVEKLEARFNG